MLQWKRHWHAITDGFPRYTSLVWEDFEEEV